MSLYNKAPKHDEKNDYPLYFVKIFHDNFLQETRASLNEIKGLSPKSRLQKGLDFFGAFGKKQDNEIKLHLGGFGFKLRGSPFEGLGKGFQAINQNISEDRKIKAHRINNSLSSNEKHHQLIANQVADALAMQFSRQILAMNAKEQEKFANALVKFIMSKAKANAFPENDLNHRAEHILDAILYSKSGHALLKEFKLPAMHPFAALSPKPLKSKAPVTDFFKTTPKPFVPQPQPSFYSNFKAHNTRPHF